MQYKNQVISLNSLETLIRNAHHPEIKNTDTLCALLFGTKRIAAVVFREIMRWLPYSKRGDGAVYKSARDLAKVVNCSEKSIERARPLLAEVGFDLFKRKANGAPTIHFKQNTSRLVSKLAEVFNTTRLQILDWLMPQNVEIRNGHNVEITSTHPVEIQDVEMSESITLNKHNYISQEETQTTTEFSAAAAPEIESIRKELQTSTKMVHQWIRDYGIQRVRDVLQMGRDKYGCGKIQNLGGWVHTALKGGYTWEQPKSEQLDGMRFITGEFADFIDH